MSCGNCFVTSKSGILQNKDLLLIPYCLEKFFLKKVSLHFQCRGAVVHANHCPKEEIPLL